MAASLASFRAGVRGCPHDVLRSEKRYAWKDVDSMSTPLWEFQYSIEADVHPEFCVAVLDERCQLEGTRTRGRVRSRWSICSRHAGMHENARTRAAALVDSRCGPRPVLDSRIVAARSLVHGEHAIRGGGQGPNSNHAAAMAGGSGCRSFTRWCANLRNYNSGWVEEDRGRHRKSTAQDNDSER